MQLFEKKYQWTSQDSQTDVSFCFHVPEGLEQIRIRFTFSPGTESNPEICLPEIEGAMNRYYDSYPRDLQPMKKESFLPVKNLITISLDKDGVYLGNAHRWATTQEHLISVNQVSRGFLPPEKRRRVPQESGCAAAQSAFVYAIAGPEGTIGRR